MGTSARRDEVGISAAQARRIAIAAQGLAEPRPAGRVDRRHARAVLERLGLIQLDSVNVLTRAHELTLFARLGPHPRDLTRRLMEAGEAFEYWGHEASLLPVELHALLRWRMAAAQEGETWGGLSRLREERPDYVEEVFAQVAARGPLTAKDLDDRGERGGSWWGWDPGKMALELLFWCGRIAAWRSPTFERSYDLPERVLPVAALAAPTPSEDDARKALLLRASRALGVATAADLCAYYRLNRPRTRPLVDELVEDGALLPARVAGWRHQAYLHPEARVPRRVRARALLAPFDSLIFERDRVERTFGFHYRLEIYVPKPKRVHGYYVLPFLLGDRLVARVDLKADRADGVLLVQAAHAEDGIDVGATAEALAAELGLMAGWLGLDRVAATERGDLARPLRDALPHPPAS